MSFARRWFAPPSIRLRYVYLEHSTMGRTPPRTVFGEDGLHGTIESTAWPADDPDARISVRLDDGVSLVVPSRYLTPRQDGSYHLAVSRAGIERLRQADDLPHGEATVVPA